MKTLLIMLSLCVFTFCSCQKEVTEIPDLSGKWTLNLALGEGDCDETILIDESNLSPVLSFNTEGTLNFETDPNDNDLNNASLFTNTYSLSGDILTINVIYEEKAVDEKIAFKAVMQYNPAKMIFQGVYHNTWGDGTSCTNYAGIQKL